MMGSLWVLPTCPTSVTTEVEDIDGGPLGVLAARSGSDHHRN
jgi:hypothetical protein